MIKIHGFPNLNFAGNLDFHGVEVGEPIRIAIRNDWQETPEQTLVNLRKKWLQAPDEPKQRKLMLTDEEKLFVVHYI